MKKKPVKKKQQKKPDPFDQYYCDSKLTHEICCRFMELKIPLFDDENTLRKIMEGGSVLIVVRDRKWGILSWTFMDPNIPLKEAVESMSIYGS